MFSFMMEMPKVSVIIPVYNAQNYIKECVESLLNQTLKDCEFVFVNDGSSDKSEEILKYYQEKDSRIILINQSNRGISAARNKGLEIASGEYIGFSDNDDYLEPDMLEKLYNAAKNDNVDIIISKTILGRDGKEIIKDSVFPVNIKYGSSFIRKNIINNLLEREDLFAVWNKLYSHKLIKEYSIEFPNNREIEEDCMFNIQAFNTCKSALFLDYAGYHFREMTTSESRKPFERDYFKYALEKFHYDYKSQFKLETDLQTIDLLKSVRLIQRVFYLIFVCGIDKRFKFADKYVYIERMAFNSEIQEISKTYHKEILSRSGIFEKALLKIIQNQSKTGLYFLINTLGLIYSPKISEILRFLNGKK